MRETECDGNIRCEDWASASVTCWKKHKLIILYPNPIAGTHLLANLIAKQSIHFLVRLPILFPYRSMGKEIMAQRPNGTIAVSFVVIVILFFRQKYRMKIHRLQMLSDFYLLTGIIDTNSRPADPMFLHGNLQGVEPRCQTSFTTYEV